MTAPNLPMTHQAQLYVDLLKKTLAFTLWPEPLHPVDTDNLERSLGKRVAISLSARLLESKGLTLAKRVQFSEEQRREGQVWSLLADTMIGMKRLDNLQECVQTVLAEQ